MMKSLTIVHAMNQIFMFYSAELHFLKIMLQIWVLNYTIN